MENNIDIFYNTLNNILNNLDEIKINSEKLENREENVKLITIITEILNETEIDVNNLLNLLENKKTLLILNDSEFQSVDETIEETLPIPGAERKFEMRYEDTILGYIEATDPIQLIDRKNIMKNHLEDADLSDIN